MRHPAHVILVSRLGFPLALVVMALAAAEPSRRPGNGPPDAVPPPPAAKPPAGEILFSDDFRTLDAWQTDRAEVWSVENGVLSGHPPDGKQEHSFAVTGSEDWQDYAVDLDVCQVRGVDKGVAVRVRNGRGVAVDLRGGGYQDVLLYRQSLPLGVARVANADSVWHHLRIETRGTRYTVLVNGVRVLERSDRLGNMRGGKIALAAYTGGRGECSVFYANLFVTRLEPAR